MLNCIVPYLKSKRLWVLVLGAAFSFLAHHGHVYHINTDRLADHATEIMGAVLVVATKIMDTMHDKKVKA